MKCVMIRINKEFLRQGVKKHFTKATLCGSPLAVLSTFTLRMVNNTLGFYSCLPSGKAESILAPKTIRKIIYF